MGYSAERRTVIGVALEDLSAEQRHELDEYFDGDDNYDLWAPGSLQQRFATLAPTSFVTRLGIKLQFSTADMDEDYDSRAGNLNENFGGYAGFDISDLSLGDRGRVATEELPLLAEVIAARLTGLGRPTKPSEVRLFEYSVII